MRVLRVSWGPIVTLNAQQEQRHVTWSGQGQAQSPTCSIRGSTCRSSSVQNRWPTSPDDSLQRCRGAPSRCWNPLNIRRSNFGTLRVRAGESLLVPPVDSSSGAWGSGTGGNSTQIGDRAEDIVFRYLKQQLPVPVKESLKWTAQAGEKPGWDIKYYEDGAPVAVEVKGTTGKAFPNVGITANEWVAAQEHGPNYWLYLVTLCSTTSPRIMGIQNPAKLVTSGSWEVKPTKWRLRQSLNLTKRCS